MATIGIYILYCDIVGAPDTTPPSDNYYRIIYDSKDVIKLKSFLSSSILASRQDLMKVNY